MRHLPAPIALVLSLVLLPACDDGAADSADLPTGQAPTSTPEQQERPDEPYTPPGDRPAEENDEPEAPAANDETGQEPAINPVAERTQGPGLSFVLPEGWTVGPDKPFRDMTLVAPDKYNNLELSISRGSGDYGGFHGNVTRWAGQVGLTAADAAKIDSFESVNVAGIDAIWLPLINQDADRAILTVWAPRGEDPSAPDETWVFKFPAAPGPVTPVNAAAEDVKAIVESVEFE